MSIGEMIVSVIGVLWIALQVVNMFFSKRGEESPEMKRMLHDVQQTRQAVQVADENGQEQMKEIRLEQKLTALNITTNQERMLAANTTAQQNVLSQTTTNMALSERIERLDVLIRGNGEKQGLRDRIMALERTTSTLEISLKAWQDELRKQMEHVRQGGTPKS